MVHLYDRLEASKKRNGGSKQDMGIWTPRGYETQPNQMPMG
jgi:hypothetical protein